MNDYTNAKLVADRQLRYLRQAEQYRLASLNGERGTGRAHGIIRRLGSVVLTADAVSRIRRAVARPPVAPAS